MSLFKLLNTKRGQLPSLFIIKLKNSDLYLLKVKVNNPKPIVSLLIGFKDELEIKGSKAFIENLKVKNSFKI